MEASPSSSSWLRKLGNVLQQKEGAKQVRATRNSRRQDSVQEQERNLQGIAVCSQTSRKSWGVEGKDIGILKIHTDRDTHTHVNLKHTKII